MKSLSVVAFGVLLLLTSPSMACKGLDKLLEDDFSTNNMWRELAPEMQIAQGTLQLSVEPNHHSSTSYEGDFFPSGDACVTVIAPDIKDDNIGIGGLMFHLTGNYEFYTFVVAAGTGQAAIMRYSNGEYLYPVAFKPTNLVQTGPKSSNTIRVTWQENGSVAAYINDKPFANIKVKPPRNSKIGFYAESMGGTWSFDNLLVTSVP